MSKIIRSIVVGIVLALTLGTAAHAHPLARTSARKGDPAGVTEKVWNWWTQLVERVAPTGRSGMQALQGKAGSQMDPNGIAVYWLLAPSPTAGAPSSL
ncbi:MAG TPA: hypothetical protein VFE33_18425 [Thermoanaerobaculia bacterium]|nr:hypothetical protein [Thermoanaerobaculia bacterium]